ncbi:ATP-binding protein [Clostridium thermobutyricum]|uniref:ATP-binding protein n=1 Tax=Clostridium thermobutyricum TaxID=29372 RepID=UPI0018AC8415|nr:ATP-binding protein [Clostridium thermobutyricum]
MYNNLEQIIKQLIESGVEGDYWDFKQKWHKDNEELIKDILAFTNTVHNKDCFLIIGVSDTCQIVGVEDDEHRKKQADLLDTLGRCNFAGENMPKIALENIELESKELDILIVYNIFNTPVYINKRTKSQKKLRENYIYSRVEDKNTSMDQNSNIYIIENLWKKRFGLNRDSIELFKEALKDKWNWNENKYGWYYKYNPEFLIRIFNIDNDRENPFYAYIMTNESTSYNTLQIVYKNVVLEEYEKITLDSGRYCIVAPEFGYIYRDIYKREMYEYRYYIKGSLEYLLYEFLYRVKKDQEGKTDAYWNRLRLEEVILILNNNSEKELFENYVYKNLIEFEKHVEEELLNNKKYVYHDERKNKWVSERIIIGRYLRKLLNKFRKLNN